MVELPADVEQALRDLPENEWSALQARLRPPDPAEQLRSAVAQHVPESQLDGVMAVVNTSAFLAEDGQVDQTKVSEHFGRFFGNQQPRRIAPPQRGQYSGNMPGRLPGADARAALGKRHGVQNDNPTPGPAGIRSGGRGREALARRHGKASNE